MKYKIVNNSKGNTEDVVKKIKKQFPKNFIESDDPDFVISIGGDGTFLRSIRENIEYNPIFVSINNGNLGFYSEYETHEVSELIKDIESNDFKTIYLSLIETEVDGHKITSVNEIAIMSLVRTTQMETFINDQKLLNFRGTGIAVSTQMGSTGLTRSLGGSIVLPGTDIFQLVEIASINNNTYRSLGSPLVMDMSKSITFKGISSPINIISDGKPIICVESGEIKISNSKKKAKLLIRGKTNYISKLKESFIYN